MFVPLGGIINRTKGKGKKAASEGGREGEAIENVHFEFCFAVDLDLALDGNAVQLLVWRACTTLHILVFTLYSKSNEGS